MVTLAFDSSTKLSTVACQIDGAVYGRSEGNNDHSANLIEMIQSVLAEGGASVADVTAIVVGMGPGSFTGLRIGLATAKGIALGGGATLHGISSMLSVAATEATLAKTTLVVSDAQRREVFAGLYERDDNGMLTTLEKEIVVKPNKLTAAIASWPTKSAVAIGSGINKFSLATSLEAHCASVDGDAPCVPSAEALLKQFSLGTKSIPLAAAGPMYIRPSEVELKFPDGNPGGAFAPK